MQVKIYAKDTFWSIPQGWRDNLVVMSVCVPSWASEFRPQHAPHRHAHPELSTHTHPHIHAHIHTSPFKVSVPVFFTRTMSWPQYEKDVSPRHMQTYCQAKVLEGREICGYREIEHVCKTKNEKTDTVWDLGLWVLGNGELRILISASLLIHLGPWRLSAHLNHSVPQFLCLPFSLPFPGWIPRIVQTYCSEKYKYNQYTKLKISSLPDVPT